MLIFDENTNPVIIDSIHSPIQTDHLWVLDLSIMDYTLAPLVMLEEVICPSMQIQIQGFEFVLPANWNILVYDSDTSQLDVIELSQTAGREFTALVYGPAKPYPTPSTIVVTNYFIEYKNIGPSLNKHQMLCHAIDKDAWCSVGPSDNFNKYLKDKTIGDLMGN
jgi:hypothetical protein